MTDYETQDGLYRFNFNYKHRTFENSRGSGFADDLFTDCETEITDFGVWQWVIDDDVEVLDDAERQRLLSYYYDELCEYVATIEV